MWHVPGPVGKWFDRGLFWWQHRSARLGAKRALTLAERGLDFADALRVFEDRSLTAVDDTAVDDRIAYGEVRYLTYGWLDERAVAVVWTEREGRRRVISMRHMHRWEIEHVGLD